MLDEHWQTFLREAPEQASFFGDYRYNDAWGDYSLAEADRQARELDVWLTRFSKIDPAGLAESDRLNLELIQRRLRSDREFYALKLHEMPLDQMNGLHLLLPIVAGAFPFNNVQQYDEYITRLRAMPKLLDQITERARQGAKDGLIPPRYLLEKVVAQCDGIADPAGADNVFAASLRKFPDAVPAAERERIRKAMLAAIDEQVRPAFRKLSQFVAEEYAPQGREQLGIWSLPQGEKLYAYLIRQQASTSMSAEQIHQLGLAEVARIERTQAEIARKLGYADLKAMRAAVRTDPKQHAQSREQILELYRKYVTQMEPRLPELFGLLPKTSVEVHAIEPYREKSASAAGYMPGTPDGSRPGMITVNTSQPTQRLLMPIEAIAYHEGIPGHHLQNSITRALPELPPFRRLIGEIAYIEGWGLYSERLGKELGFYQDPYSEFGRLAQELVRANRLVLDTGVHHKRWTREQMVSWYREHSDSDEPNIQAEVDRYIANPGQALAYKIGELKIVELRERAQRKLGERFDIRAFHDQVLGGGALPLDVLESRVDAWIAQQAGAAKGA
ncbi:DUF885 family protein [Lysobacter silvisoli]|uniref:DUF885 family protein n=1 Tax=Lysobacter silvisoli TaxID=2293254 RepID=A0A371JXF4_9GAMM|nr:DUF885 family protein [Lysobacter silvisoli]